MSKKRVLGVVLAVLVAAPTYAQTTDFFALIVKTGSADGVQAAIDQGADVNARNEDGFTPLILAVVLNPDPDVIATLLKAGAKANARDTKFEMTPLMWAAKGNQSLKVISTLLNNGADVNARDTDGLTALMDAAKTNLNPDVIATPFKAGDGPTANNNLNPDWQQAFADQSFDPALAAAMRRELGPWPVLPRSPAPTVSVAAPGVLNPGDHISTRDRDGITALMEAAHTNPNPDVIAALLRAGANAKAMDTRGKTALDYAQYNTTLKGTPAFRQLQEASRF